MNIFSKLLQFYINPHLYSDTQTNRLEICKDCMEEFFNLFKIPVIISDVEYNPVIFNKYFTDIKHIDENFLRILDASNNWIKIDITDKNNSSIGYIFFKKDTTDTSGDTKTRTTTLNEIFSYFVENSTDVLFQCDTSLNLKFVSTSVEKFLGYSVKDILQTGVNKIFLKEDLVRIRDEIQKIISNYKAGQPIDEEYLFELRFIHKNCFYVWGEIKANPIFDDNDQLRGIQGIVRDITDKKRREDEIFQLRKLEIMGQIAGGIAHDFNNILTGILGNVSLAKFSLEKESRIHYLLEHAEEAVERAKVLTSQLLTFARGGEPVIQRINIKDILIDYTKFILSGQNVRLEFEIQDRLWEVEIDKSQFLNAIQNIIINACEASKKGDTIFISCYNFSHTDNNTHLTMRPGNYVEIEIQDCGAGIPENLKDKILEPFFTTKEKKTGLGLTIAYSIIKWHHGYIFIDSEKDRGTTVKIYIPAVTEMINEEKISTDENLFLKGKTILIMDDEKDIRDFVKNVLTIYGANVLTASHGKEALDYYKLHKNIDLTITDLTVPGGMGGDVLIKKILKINGNAKVIVSSGYSSDPIMQHYKDYGFYGVLPKPFKMDNLISVIKKALSD